MEVPQVASLSEALVLAAQKINKIRNMQALEEEVGIQKGTEMSFICQNEKQARLTGINGSGSIC